MFAAQNIEREIEKNRRLIAFTNNVIALLGLLVLGFPVTPATIRTAVAGSVLFAGATLQFVWKYTRLQTRMVLIRTRNENLL